MIVGAPALAVMLALGAVASLAPAQPAYAQVRGLPDFTDLVEQVGPSVVNIRTVEKARACSAQSGGMNHCSQRGAPGRALVVLSPAGAALSLALHRAHHPTSWRPCCLKSADGG